METRKRYHTKQQNLILDCIKNQKGNFYSIDQFMIYLQNEGIRIGQTTVYRAMERFTEDGVVMKIPSLDGKPALYSLAGNTEKTAYGKLVCIKCGSTVSLQCDCIQNFAAHIQKEHHFELNQQSTILYGYCEKCRNN